MTRKIAPVMKLPARKLTYVAPKWTSGGNKNSSNGDNKRSKGFIFYFQAEFEQLPTSFPADRTTEICDRPANRPKNRYPDIKCYDQTRVRLKLPNENAEKDAEKDKAEKQPNDKDSPSDDDKRSEGMYCQLCLKKEINIFE